MANSNRKAVRTTEDILREQDWRDSQMPPFAHPDLRDKAPAVDPAEVRTAIRERISQVRHLAVDLPDPGTNEELGELGVYLGNLNEARICLEEHHAR